MKRYLSLFLVVFTLLLIIGLVHSITACPVTLIHKSCKKAAQHDPKFNYNFCVKSLEAGRGTSEPANLEELTVLSLQIGISNATHLRSYIKKLMKQKKFDPYAKECLKDCDELYSDAKDGLEDAILALKVSKDYAKANLDASAALTFSVTCEDGFGDKEGEVSPLTKENAIFVQLSAISLTFITMLHENHMINLPFDEKL